VPKPQPHADSNTDPNCDINADPDTYSKPQPHADSNTDPNCDINANGHAERDAHSDANGNRYTYSYRNTDSDT
jgi:hypothetical protein